NTNIFADPDVIIPKVDIKKGVTLVELNVTVKDVIIESNDDIKVTGKGNVENVVINTDKTVTLDTTGQIKNLESKNENSKVTIGENAKIVNVTVPEGKKAEDIVQNFEQVKDNIEKVGGNKNPDYQPSDSGTSPSTGGSGSGGGSSRPSTGGGSTNPNEETGDFFAAGILEGSKFGYVKLNPKNRGNYKVKYVLVDRNSSKEPYLLESGATVPSDAIEYQENSEFILWANHEIFVYLVDENNKVIDTVDVNEEWYWGEIDFDVNKEAKELTIKTNINRGNQSVAQMFESIYLFNADKATKITDFSNIDWKEIDGLPAVTLNYGDDFDPSQFNRVIVHLSNYGLMTTIHDVLEGSHDSEQEEAVDIYALEYLVKENNRNDFSWVLDNIAREKVESPDGDGSIEYRYLTENDSVSTKKYFEVISQKLNEISNSEDVKKVVLDINEELKEEVDSYKEARASVDRLFKEDRHDYGEDEQLKEGLKQEEIDAARVLVQAVSNEFTEKEILGWEIYYAEYLLNKPLVEDFIEELKKEIEITNPVIGLSISDLLYKEKPQKLQIKVNGLGNEVKEEADYSYVSGDIQYLSVDASGKLILNRLNTSGESVTEYASIQLEIGDNYYDEKIVAVTIPSSETDETASSVTAIELKENPSYIRYISNYAVNKKVSLKPGISVGQLIEAIQAEDGSTQTYKVTNADGEEKTSGLIEHGDRLIVTAANGQSKDIYNLEIPIVIQNLKAAEFGKLTFEAENTSLDELKTLIGLYQENPYSESSDRADFTLNEAKDENKNTKPNHYEINIYNAAKDVAYQISIARNKGKQVEFQSSNPDQLAWRSFQVIDTDANPDTEATITDFGSLTLDLDTVKVQLKDSRNYEEEWAETVTIDGVAISSEVKEEGGEWKIHFKSEGTDKGEVDDYRYLRVTVTAAGIPNRESINLEVSPEGSITVRRW
ncbi:MAG TPA: hypothetical protein VEY51_18330, partial [Chondromyces sp.]|nr:hypothetical protein [Chondromyces sp.]